MQICGMERVRVRWGEVGAGVSKAPHFQSAVAKPEGDQGSIGPRTPVQRRTHCKDEEGDAQPRPPQHLDKHIADLRVGQG